MATTAVPTTTMTIRLPREMRARFEALAKATGRNRSALAQEAIRRFLSQYRDQHGATVLLTSHYMEDVAVLCPRVMVIDKGRMIYDGALPELIRRVRPDKRVILRLSKPVERRDLEALGTVIEHVDAEAIIQVSQDGLQSAVARALATLPLRDLTVEDPPLEEVMRDLFAQGRAA